MVRSLPGRMADRGTADGLRLHLLPPIMGARRRIEMASEVARTVPLICREPSQVAIQTWSEIGATDAASLSQRRQAQAAWVDRRIPAADHRHGQVRVPYCFDRSEGLSYSTSGRVVEQRGQRVT